MKNIRIVEVGPRDGLQNEKNFIPTAEKITWINLLSNCGYKAIEVTSFVSPKWVPQMADHREVFLSINKNPLVHYPVLIPNTKGFEAALAVGVKEIAIFIAASETFSQKNTNCSIAESVSRVEKIMQMAKQNHIQVRGYISCIINCPYEGKIEREQVTSLTETLLALGCYEVSLGDTTGKARPEEIRHLLALVSKTTPKEKLAGHFHDTDNHAIANIQVAFEEFGISTFDSSLTGLGGCPYAPGAKGNVATEKVIAFFEQKGIDTGINKTALALAQNFINATINAAH